MIGDTFMAGAKKCETTTGGMLQHGGCIYKVCQGVFGVFIFCLHIVRDCKDGASLGNAKTRAGFALVGQLISIPLKIKDVFSGPKRITYPAMLHPER